MTETNKLPPAEAAPPASAFAPVEARGVPLRESENSVTVDPDLTVDVPDSIPVEERETYVREVLRVREMRKVLPPLGAKLALPTRPGYYRHWFNDKPGRIEVAEQGGWGFIRDKKGQALKRVVGTGRDNGAMYAYAMEIPIIFFEDMMRQKHAMASEKMDELKKPTVAVPQGVAKASDADKFYSRQSTPVSIRETVAKVSQ